MIIQFTTPQVELWRIDGEFSNLPHSHESEYQITVPMRGICHFTLENRPHRLVVGGALVQHPGERHYFEADDQSGLLIFKIQRQAFQNFPDFGRSELEVRHQLDASLLSRQFRIWTGSLLMGDPCNQLVQEETETQVISYLCAALSGSHSDKAGGPSSMLVPSGQEGYIKRVLEYIHSHYREEISVETLSSIALQSRFHFIRSFKAATGVTPYQYVMRLRMEAAKHELQTTDRTVTEIAVSLGYSGGNTFYRAFTKVFGVTPEQSRSTGNR